MPFIPPSKTNLRHHRTVALLIAPIFSLFLLGAAPTVLPKQSHLPLDLAVKVAGAALKKCMEDGYRVSVAVVDRGGNTQALLRADGAGPHTLQSSTKKAYTAASLGRPTSELANMIKERPELQGLRDMDERILILAGGLPIAIEGELIGGIGVGGAPGGHLDEACAKAGLESLSEK
ncbi:MAG: heme-binding protein [Candidatus Manganitrophaceae bacterium]|nr:MAG: heme-binding protein [Candidatus Manganitrophaceae bacterium]